MITLKEAFGSQKRLANLIDQTVSELHKTNFIVSKEEHFVVPDSNPTIKIIEKESIFDHSDLLTFLAFAIDEYIKLGIKIEDAKRATFPMDAMKATNILVQKVISDLSAGLDAKSSVEETLQTTFERDVNGNQVSVLYPMVSKKSYDMNKNTLRKKLQNFDNQVKKNSQNIERSLVESLVDYKLFFDEFDELEDIINSVLVELES